MDGAELLERREPFGPLLPIGVVLLTAGVDVQNDRLEVEIVGWGRDEESWSVEYRVLFGDPAAPAVWEALDELLAQTFPHGRDIPDLMIRATAIDTGGHHTMRSYDFCRTRQKRRIWAIKGRGGMGLPIWPRLPTRSNKGRIPLYNIGVDTYKEAIHARLRLREPGPGYCHFPLDRDVDYFKQLTAERVVTRYHRGQPIREWKKLDHDRNEALDTRVYAMAALHGLITMGLRLNREAERLVTIPLKPLPGQEKSIEQIGYGGSLARYGRPRNKRITFLSPWM